MCRSQLLTFLQSSGMHNFEKLICRFRLLSTQASCASCSQNEPAVYLLRHEARSRCHSVKLHTYRTRNRTSFGNWNRSQFLKPYHQSLLPSTSARFYSSEASTSKSSTPSKPKSSKNFKAVMARTQQSKEPRATNKLITPLRACREYALELRDLHPLPRQVRRSPFFGEPPETMYLLTDIQQVAAERHGSMDLARRRAIQRAARGQRGYALTEPLYASMERFDNEDTLLGSSTGRVVLLAIALNGSLALAKALAWWFTSSHSMFAEMLHSLADTGNQIVVALGVRESKRAPDREHPYGYSNFGHVTSLISGVGIFFVGTGLSWYEGIHALGHAFDPFSMTWAFGVLGGSLICESATLAYAVYVLKQKAARERLTLMQYIRRTDDPSLNVVLLEDTAAVIGILTAAVCIGLSQLTQSVVPDALGSFLIGCLLAGSAYSIIRQNTSHLMVRSIPEEERDVLIRELENDVMVRAVRDVKATELGAEKQRLKAELDFEGRNITRAYLESQDLPEMLREMNSFGKVDQVESFMLRHGEGVVDRLGTEVDRIEAKLKKRHPELRHIDLEAL